MNPYDADSVVTQRRRAAEALVKFWGDLDERERAHLRLFISQTAKDPMALASAYQTIERNRGDGKRFTAETAPQAARNGIASQVSRGIPKQRAAQRAARGDPTLFGIDPHHTVKQGIRGVRAKYPDSRQKFNLQHIERIKGTPKSPNARKKVSGDINVHEPRAPPTRKPRHEPSPPAPEPQSSEWGMDIISQTLSEPKRVAKALVLSLRER